MRMSDKLWPMMLSYLLFATQYIEARRADVNELQTRPFLKRLYKCSFGGKKGGKKPDFKKIYPCVLDKGQTITRVVDGKKVSLKKYCRVKSEGLNENVFTRRLDDLTSLVMSQAKASGITKTHDQLKVHLTYARVNIWIEKLGGELISHSAFYAGLEPNATCAVGGMGTLVVASAWHGKKLAKENELLTDLAYDLGYMAFHTTTKVTNLESLKTQRRKTTAF
eukprot:TRINITY_DN8048_c0_g1_i5.p1 TRINITY_DN8048_c0_g1~~TRINITY_DN8048_c0_g1_i5.p1  ORF type:complete len:222 (+),score=24.45 TRINITY_DN8048_c0_g1_i5:100-765(+)